MVQPETTNYLRVAKAIEYIKKNFRQQPGLDDIAEQLHLSPFHFQRIFKEWAGVSPKQFLQYLNIEYAKLILKEQTIAATAYQTGFSGSSRLHDLFIKIEGMTPGEYKNGGKHLNIHYSFTESPFGQVLIASTSKGICYMAFADEKTHAFISLQYKFPNATFLESTNEIQQNAIQIFNGDWKNLNTIKLNLKGTAFQLKVWEALLKIPAAKLSTYTSIANAIDNPKAVRAVGTAVGDNPVAFLIPCHRVIRSTGEFGQYHWGSTRKTAIIGWEAARWITDQSM